MLAYIVQNFNYFTFDCCTYIFWQQLFPFFYTCYKYYKTCRKSACFHHCSSFAANCFESYQSTK